MGTLISAAYAAIFTSRGVFAHLWTTPLCWGARDVAVVISEMSAPINFNVNVVVDTKRERCVFTFEQGVYLQHTFLGTCIERLRFFMYNLQTSP